MIIYIMLFIIGSIVGVLFERLTELLTPTIKSLNNKTTHIVEIGTPQSNNLVNEREQVFLDLMSYKTQINDSFLFFIADNFKLKKELELMEKNLTKAKSLENFDKILLKDTFEFLVELQKDIKSLFSGYIQYMNSSFICVPNSEKMRLSKEYTTYLHDILPSIKIKINYLNNKLNEEYNLIQQQNILKLKNKYTVDIFPEFEEIKNQILSNEKYNTNNELIHTLNLIENNFIKPYIKNTDFELKSEIDFQIKELINLLKDRMNHLEKYYISTDNKDLKDLIQHNHYFLQQIKNHY